MTPSHDIEKARIPIDVVILRKSIQFALNHRAQNVLITGKGEPTLYPAQISQYLAELKGLPFDKRELQTEGSYISREGMTPMLETWRYLDLDYIAISIYHYNPKLNQEMFRNPYGYSPVDLCIKLTDMGYRVRLSCVMAQGYIDSIDKVNRLLDYARECGAIQLSLRTVDCPPNPVDKTVAKNARKYRLTDTQYENIMNHFRKHGIYCDKLPHGAEIWEINGQNICITDGLSDDAGKDNIRQLVFFPQGILTSSWVTVNGSRVF